MRFETMSFRQDMDYLHITFLRLFSTKIPLTEMARLGGFTVEDAHTITFDKPKAEERFSLILTKYFSDLKNKLTGNKVTYIHRNSEIPLIGNVAFGIVYRNSSIIEIKPVTSCNLDCVYCSISEGLSSKKNDFVVEKEYMVEELQKLLKFVAEPVEIHIGVQGEPFLYADMQALIEALQALPQVHTISIDTNGTLLNKEKIDALSKNSKLQLNLSLDAIDPEQARQVAGVKTYNVNHVKEIIAYAAQKLKVIVAPVLTPGWNEHEIEEIIAWIKGLLVQPILGVQNFLRYKTGRNPGREMAWDEFYALLEELEKKHGIKLRLHKEDFHITETKQLPKPFSKGDVITATIKAIDRFPNSVIAVARGRNISVPNCEYRLDKQIKVEILRDKHNIFVGKKV